MALTAKDRADAAFLLTQDLDYLCLSFVQDEADVRQLRAMMADSGRAAGALPKIIVKVEKPAALLNIDGILAEADGLMVARGDLAVEIGHERVPLAQRSWRAAAKVG